MSLFNEVSEFLEGWIDRVFPKGRKPRNHRKIGRKDYLRYVKNRQPSLKQLYK